MKGKTMFPEAELPEMSKQEEEFISSLPALPDAEKKRAEQSSTYGLNKKDKLKMKMQRNQIRIRNMERKDQAM